MSFINIDEYPLELIPLDSDVLSLEMDSSFKVHQTKCKCTVFFFWFATVMQMDFLCYLQLWRSGVEWGILC